MTKYETGKVRTVAPVPLPTTATTTSITTVAPLQANTQSLTPPDLSQLTVAPKNLDLCAELNGRTVCINKKQWNKLSVIERYDYKNKWLYVTGKDENGNKHSFLLALDDSGESMTWGKAMASYGNSLPTKEQGEVIAKKHGAIYEAIVTFGGDKPGRLYWTKTELSSDIVWGVYMDKGYVYYTDKGAYNGFVREVVPVPNNK